MRLLLKTLICITALVLAAATAAAPVQLTQPQFSQQTAGLPAIVETFEGFPVGGITSPLTFANGTFTGPGFIETGFWCTVGKCLGTIGSDTVARIFSSFPSGTTFWNTSVNFGGVGTTLEFTVIGNSGTAIFTLPPSASSPGTTFVGFADPTGLLSVSIKEPSTGHVVFDFPDVTTVAPPRTAPPIPTLSEAMLALLALSLALLGMAAYRHFDRRS